MKKLILSSKKRLLSLFLSTILVLTPLTSTYASQPKDVKDHWAKEVITEWVNKGLANGYPDGNFKPNSLITRAEFMTLTNKAFGFTEEEEISFSDVSENAWYSKAIKIAKAAGYIGGYPDGTIKPINSITRQEVAIIIAKIKGLENNPSYSNIFTDANSIPTWSKGQIGALVHEGYMSGYPDGSFKASNSITRAEALVTLNRVLDPGVWIINETGTYGPSTGADIYYGDVTIKADGSILQNIIITGNLTITEDVGEGEVTLNNVIVEGNTYIRGGGPDSIYINGGDYKNIIIQKQGGKLRVVMINDKGASLIVAEESKDTEIILEGTFDKVDINTSGVFLKIQGDTRIKEIKIDNKAEDVTISTSKDTVIDLVTTDTLTNIINEGRIIRAEGTAVEASNYKSNLPDNLQPRPPSQSSGGGGGGGPSSIAVNAISVSPTTMTLIAGGVTGTIIATVSPNSATNKNVIWSSDNEAVATVVNGMVVPVAEGTAIIKATSSSDITKSAACVVTVTAPINNEPKLIVSPPQVTIDSLFNQAFTLTIQNDTVVNSVYANHISLGGVFEGINISNVDRTNDTTITATLYGNLTHTGVGRITLDADALMNSTNSLYIDVIVSDGIEVPVSAISVTGSDTVIDGQTLQLGLTIVPTNATNKEVTWSVTNETGEATIDSNGLLSAVKEGTVTVKATSKNDSSVFGEKHITITPPALSILNVNVSGTAKVGETLTLDIYMSDGQSAGDRVEYFAAVQESENSLNAIGYITVNSNTMTIPSTFELNEGGSTSIIGKHIDFGAKLKDVINSRIADRVGPISPATDLTYAINVSPVVGGTATVDVNKSVAAAGEIVSVTISDIQSGKQFKSILVNGGAIATTEISEGASYTFVMPSASATVVVEIEDEPIVTYSVTLSPVVGGTATVNVDKSSAEAGELITVTISDIQSGKQFKSILVNGGAIATTEISEGASYTFVMPSASATVVVEIEDEPIVTYSVTVSPVVGGTATVNVDKSSAEAGELITVTISDIQSGKQFKSILVNGGAIATTEISEGASYSFVMPSASATVVVEIEDEPIVTYSVTVSPVVGGTATVNVDKSSAEAGELITVTISDIQSGKQFKSIQVNGGAIATTEISEGASYTFVMPSASATVVVEIEDEPIVTYSVTVSPVVGGTATVNVDKSVAAAGEIVSVTISNIQSGKQFKSILVNGGAIATTEISEVASYTFVMPSASATVVVEIEDEPIASPQGLLLDAEAGTNFTGVLYTRGGNIYYNKQDNNGIWDTEALIGVGLEGKLAIDGSDKPHVVYTTPENKIGYRKYDVSGWIEEVLIESNNSGACSKPDIAVDGNGHAHITYTDTKGELYGLWDYEDIMYANNSTGNFVKQVITKGYRDNSTSPWFIFRYLKGSTITINSDGNYIITLHRYFQYRDSGMPAVTTHHYGVEAKTFGASGVTTNTSSTNTDTADIYNSITKNGKTIVLYKERTFKTSELVISGGTIDFTNTNNISVSTVKSVSTDGTNIVVVGTNSGKLQAQYNDTVQDFYEIEVGSNAVYIVNIDGKFYAVYTDASDQMIKMTEVTEYN
ncbi:S-layer homology domain-containing protein [Serpentinicella alkaliphila]|uniref:Ig-like protein group 2 n=1 Tax=Serpentinicella alkaliphila TaxID=1734049 RepID=A0A4R2TH60_9FIRM|nr:S-layer homology domain-containing protein [Serpentinicella alkaliphila]QUH25008.1 S-layer homology domain-containing protein [Serpentinicella alkaliphila]TCQ02511.1 Ig-like protein group 2 [Serpentinicella alkaliphila]